MSCWFGVCVGLFCGEAVFGGVGWGVVIADVLHIYIYILLIGDFPVRVYTPHCGESTLGSSVVAVVAVVAVVVAVVAV